MFGQDVGFSGHGTGLLNIRSNALGAVVVEKHVTLSRAMSGPDQAASLEFNEFKKLVSETEDLKKAMGSSIKSLKIQRKHFMAFGKELILSLILKG